MPVIEKIKDDNSLDNLAQDNKEVLSYFISLQFNRTKAQRETFHEMTSNILDRVMKFGEGKMTDKNKAEIYTQLGYSEDETEQKIQDINLLVSMTKTCFPHFLNKKLCLLKTKTKNPFYISDNPVVMYNHHDLSPGSIGLNVKGIEIYLPISKTLCLSMLCPEAFKLLPDNVILNMSEEHVIFNNHLQVDSSETFVLSSENNFDLVEQMISDDGEYKHRTRIKMG